MIIMRHVTFGAKVIKATGGKIGLIIRRIRTGRGHARGRGNACKSNAKRGDQGQSRKEATRFHASKYMQAGVPLKGRVRKGRPKKGSGFKPTLHLLA